MTSLPPPVSGHVGVDPTAVMGRRIGAYLIDAVIAWAVMAVVFWSVSDTISARLGISCSDDNAPTLCLELGDTIRFAEGGDANLVTVSGLLVWALFGIVVQGLTGGTPGKLMVGLRVVRQDDGRLAGIGRCAARTVLWLVDAFPYIFPLVGLITGVATKGHRRVGDMAAGTLVVRADAVGTPPVVPGLTVAGAAAWSPPAPAGGPTAWMPPTGPSAHTPPPAHSADPFATPGVQVFPPPDRIEASPVAAPPPAAPPVAAPPVAAPPVAAPPVAAPPVAAPPPEPVAAPPPEPVDDQPRWDPERNAYVWFDAGRQQWMVHDTASDQWHPM